MKPTPLLDPHRTLKPGNGEPFYDVPFEHLLQPALSRLRDDHQTEAYRVGDRSITFGEIGARAEAVRRQLHNSGVAAGQVVTLLGHPTVDWIAGALGVLASGATLAPLDHHLTPFELEGLVSRTGSILTLATQGCPLTGGAVLPIDDRPASGPLQLEGNGVAVILPTSGSTGVPKPVMLTHRNLIQGLMSFVDVLGCGSDERTCIAVPIFHVTGLVDQLLQMLWLGGMCRILPEYSTTAMIQSLVEDEITMMISVPAVFAMLVQRPPASSLALRLALYGGSPISTTTVRSLQSLIPGVVAIQGYGMTEMSSLATALPPERAHDAPGSVGIPSPITKLRIVSDSGESRDGELGEILLTGPNRTPGYLGMPEATAAAIDDEGWYHTGDIGWRDPTGLIYFAGRKSQLINRGGEKVSPREIESALCEVEGVAEAVAFGLPHEILGEVPAAALVPVPGSVIDPARVEQVMGERLAQFKWPTKILTLDTIPLAVTGKPDLARLRELCEAG